MKNILKTIAFSILFTPIAGYSSLEDISSERGIHTGRSVKVEEAVQTPLDRFNLAVRLYEDGGIRDQRKAFEIFKRLTRTPQGNADAEFYVGYMYYTKQGVFLRDDAKAFEYLMRSACKGHAKAQFTVGQMYETGKAPKLNNRNASRYNEQEALNWYARAAAQGHEVANEKIEAHNKKIETHNKSVPVMNGIFIRKLVDQSNKRSVDEDSSDSDEDFFIKDFF